MSTISASGTIYIQQQGLVILYSTDNTTWTPISSWPVTIVNTTPTQILKVLFTSDIYITSSANYFICGSTAIQFGDTSLRPDGTRPTIAKSSFVPGFTYAGLIQNGQSGVPGYSNITIVNLIIDGTDLILSGGWIGQSYYAYGTTGNKIVNCSSIGAITAGNGGIVGQFDGTGGGNLTLLGCSSSGAIAIGGGGIVGQVATGDEGGIVTAIQCFSTGDIGQNAGGIFGPFGDNCVATKCYSTGTILGPNAGGIYGRSSGTGTACFATACYSRGNIGAASAGIDPDGNFTHVSTTNCYSSGTIDLTAGGIQGGGAAVSVPSHTYTSGLSAGGAIGGIKANSALDGSTNYSEANSGGNTGAWSDANAAATLQGIGTTWASLAPNTPYVLLNFGTTPYSLAVVDPATYDLIQTYAATVTAGEATSAAVAAGYTAFTILSGGHPTITIDPTGIISTTVATPPGIYTLTIYGVDEYTTTTYVLTVLGAPAPAPSPAPADPCCNETVPPSLNPQTGNSADSAVTAARSNRTIGRSTDTFYAGIAAGTRGAYPQPLFRSYAEYMQYLQGKTRY